MKLLIIEPWTAAAISWFGNNVPIIYKKIIFPKEIYIYIYFYFYVYKYRYTRVHNEIKEKKRTMDHARINNNPLLLQHWNPIIITEKNQKIVFPIKSHNSWRVNDDGFDYWPSLAIGHIRHEESDVGSLTNEMEVIQIGISGANCS